MTLLVLYLRTLRGGGRYASLLALVLAACTAPESGGGESRTDAAVAVSTQALSEKPDDKCAVAVFQGHEYWFCSQNKSWSSARTQCQLKGLDLARIDSAAENAFIYSNLRIDAWIGASDQAAEGQWRWPDGVQFWNGGVGGSPMGGLYENWASGQPDNFFNQDCGAIETVFVAGEWADRACTELLDFVCERALDPGEAGVDCSTDNAPEGASWSSFRRCPSHQATAGLIGAQAAETFATYATGGDVESSPAVGADGTIYFGSNDSYLYALNPDLTLAWRFDTAGAVRSSPAIGADGTIYFGSDDGRLYALNPNGTQKWSYLTLGAIWSSPVVSENGNVYVGSDNSRFYAFSPTGTKLWDIDTGAFVRSSAAISPDGTIYIGYEDWRLDAVNPDGSTKWSFGTLGPVTSSPAIGPDGTVYVGSFDGHLYAIHPGNGSEKWSFATSSPVTSSPAVAPDGSIVFGDDSGRVRALNPNGTLKWSYLTGDDVISSPAIGSDGVVYIGSYDNNVRALDPDDGSVLWTLATGADVFSSPAIGDNGVVYIGSDDDKLYAIGVDDQCPDDPNKIGPGQCGCGSADIDSDGDGTADCLDDCDTDPTRSAVPCSPEAGCDHMTFGESQYFFCDTHRDWDTAKSKCNAVGMQLARIDDAAENDFVKQHVLTDRWIGGSDSVQEGVWRWEIGAGSEFWHGDYGGNPVGGAYTSWFSGQPDNSGLGDGEDCVHIAADGTWRDDNCDDTEQYICESPQDAGACIDDAPPADPAAPTKQEFARWVECVGAGDPDFTECDAAFLGQVNADRTAMAKRIAAGTVESNEYLAVINDRARKLEIAFSEPTYACAAASGDDDEDLVPNSLDACPGTPELTATTNDGCTDPTLPEAPPTDRVRQLVNALGFGFLRSPNCDGSPRPELTEPRFVAARAGGVILVFDKVRNTNPGCEVAYEVFARTFTENIGGGMEDERYHRFAFVERPNQNQLSGCTGPADDLGCTNPPVPLCDDEHIVFFIPSTSTEPAMANYRDIIRSPLNTPDLLLTHHLQIRAVDGNGKRTVWSEIIAPGVGQCFPL